MKFRVFLPMFYCVALLSVSLLPSVFGMTGMVYFYGALALGLTFLGFVRHRDASRWFPSSGGREQPSISRSVVAGRREMPSGAIGSSSQTRSEDWFRGVVTTKCSASWSLRSSSRRNVGLVKRLLTSGLSPKVSLKSPPLVRTATRTGDCDVQLCRAARLECHHSPHFVGPWCMAS